LRAIHPPLVISRCWLPSGGDSFRHGPAGFQALAAGLLWAPFVLGWLYLVAATFAIHHFDLFGLRQAYYHFMGKPRPGLEFVKRAMYRLTRHPIQTGVPQ
jgi:hypothetical protein